MPTSSGVPLSALAQPWSWVNLFGNGVVLRASDLVKLMRDTD